MHAFMNRGSRKTACCGSPFHISSHLTVIDNKLTGTPKFNLIFGLQNYVTDSMCIMCGSCLEHQNSLLSRMWKRKNDPTSNGKVKNNNILSYVDSLGEPSQNGAQNLMQIINSMLIPLRLSYQTLSH